MAWNELVGTYKDVVFLGESGSGKSELAINLALELRTQTKSVHLWDIDQTKPLFRARDVEHKLVKQGIAVHYDVQMEDAPTLSGGIASFLLDRDSRVILDVGGGDIGARLIGGLSHLLKREDVVVFYVINPYCAWSDNLESIDKTFSAILASARIRQVHFLANPNLGEATSAADFTLGLDQVMQILPPQAPLVASAVPYWLADVAAPIPLIPIYPQLRYPWQTT